MITGKCHCGDISYKIEAEKGFEFLCHCTDCRVLNGGGYLAGMVFPKQSLSFTGNTKTYTYPGGTGDVILNFCPKCATTVFAYPTAHPEIVVLRANSLDECMNFTPKKSLFGDSAFTWDKTVIKSKKEL